jgi:hypothetical protein
MTDKARIICHSPTQAHKALTDIIWPFVKANTFNGTKIVVEAKPENRSLDQNALLHAALTDIANQVVWHGQKLSMEVWKRLCVASWLRENNENPMLIPALDGHGVDIIFEKTSKLSTKQCASLVEWCFAFGAEHGVNFRAVASDT